MTPEQHAFDPYLKWLGIRTSDQPPDHYRLLGLESFEADADVISNAADARMLHIKTFQSGKYSQYSQRLLNEIAAAKLCLLNPEKKAAYDQTLRAQLEANNDRKRRFGWGSKKGSESPVLPPSPPKDGASLPAPSREQFKVFATIAIFAAISVAVVAALTSRPHTSEVARPSGAARPDLPAALRPRPMSHDSPTRSTPDEPQNPVAVQAPEEQSPEAGNAAAGVTSGVDASPGGTSSEPVEPPSAVLPETMQPKVKAAAEPPSPPSPPPPAPEPDPETNPVESMPEKMEPPAAQASTPSGEPADGSAPAEAKPPVPSEAEQAAARQEIRASHENDFVGAKTPETMLVLADSLLQEAEQTEDNPVRRYMLARMSLELAVGAGQIRRASEVADRLAVWYEIDPMEVKADLLSGLADARRNEPSMSVAQLETIESGLELIREAVNQDKYEAADRMHKPVLATARKTKNADIVQHVVALGKEIGRLKSEFEKFRAARETLAGNPKDPAANLAMGRRLCFEKDQWEQGLVHLSHGSNSALADLAKRDLAAPTSSEEQRALGDGWWEQAEKETGQTKIAMQLRAAHWYRQDFAGVNRESTRKRLAEVAQLTPPEDAWKEAVKQPGNIALASNGAQVDRGGEGLIDGLIPPAANAQGGVRQNWPCRWTVVFDQVYAIREIRLRLPEGRNTYENYGLEISVDGKRFFPLVDRTKGLWSGWQQFRFLARPVKAIRLTGTFSSAGRQFHALELEAYYVPPES